MILEGHLFGFPGSHQSGVPPRGQPLKRASAVRENTNTQQEGCFHVAVQSKF